jgi:hypothetical protein
MTVRSLSVLLGICGVLLAACGDNGLFPGIPIDLPIERQTVPGFAGHGAASCDFPTSASIGSSFLAPLTINLRDSEELRGKSFIRFTRVTLEKVVLSIRDVPAGDSDTWDFLTSIRIFADDPSDGEPPVLVARLDPVPRGKTEITIRGTGVNIADIASADRFVVTGDVSGFPPCDDVVFDGEADFEVAIF